jgi:hypothetical protein
VKTIKYARKEKNKKCPHTELLIDLHAELVQNFI